MCIELHLESSFFQPSHGLHCYYLKVLLESLWPNTTGIVSPVCSTHTRPPSDLLLNFCTLTFPIDLNLSFFVASLTLISPSSISHVLWQLTDNQTFSLPLSVSLVSRFASGSLSWHSPMCPSCLACSKCRLVQHTAGIPAVMHLGPSIISIIVSL